MTMRPIQLNTKFINHLQLEWNKFVTDVKLAKDFNNTNFDQLYAYLRQHEAHADEVRIMKERFQNPLALQQILQQLYDIPIVQQRSSQAPVTNHSLVVHHQSYQAPEVHQPSQASFPLMDSGLVDPSFLPFDDPIASINKVIDFISTAFTSRCPSTNNQLRTSSNPSIKQLSKMEEFKYRLFKGDKIKGMQAVVLRVMLQLQGVTELGNLTQQVRQRLYAATTVKRKATWQDNEQNLKGLGI
ncbi:hypothetical protein Tco_0344390 [Tanacetum coccineum]